MFSNIGTAKACDTKSSTSGSVNTSGVKIEHSSEKKDCGKPECKTSGSYDGRHDKKK